ncbi:MAG: hypothetical protein ACK4HF_17470 [Paracoccaceae bacterium]
MTETDPPQSPSTFAAPSLQLPWMQALIHAGAPLERLDETVTEASGDTRDAVHYVRCGFGPGTVEDGTDFLSAVTKARRLVATGARRIVFLTSGDTHDGRLHHSLLSLARHAGRALTVHPAEFAVIPVQIPALRGASIQTPGPSRPRNAPPTP